MILDQHKDIASWAMKYALENGCSASRVALMISNNNSFEYRNDQLDKLHQSAENKLYIELFVDGRYGAFSTNRIERKELERFISEGILSTRFLAEDLCRQLPDAVRYYKPGTGSLDLYDPAYDNISTEQKIELCKNTVNEIYQTNADIISVTASLGDACAAEYMVSSNGFEGETTDSAFSITAEVTLRTDTDARPESYWYDNSVYWADLQKSGIASKALERALGKVNQKKIKSGKYNLLLDNTVSARMLSPIVSAIFGSALQQKNSFLIGKLGCKIASDELSLADTPHLPRSFGARWFDGEGVATSNRCIIENGILRNYFIDTYNALKMGIEPTIASPSILGIKPGNNSFGQMLKSMHNGIWVTGFNGGNCNPTTGDFSFGIEGFSIENGIIVEPIGEMNITGNILKLWASLIEIGNDPRANSSMRVPSLLFMDVNFSGA